MEQRKNLKITFFTAACVFLLMSQSCSKFVEDVPEVIVIEDESKLFESDDSLWRSRMFDEDLQIPEEIEGKNDHSDFSASIDIRAFKHKFHKSLDSTWVLGYVKSGTKRGSETALPPTIEAHNGQMANITWNNLLQKTIIENERYPKFKKNSTDSESYKFLPIIYNVLDANRVKMVEEMLYTNPLMTCNMSKSTSVRGAEKECRCADTMEMSSYYSTTVHLHGAWLSWKYDGYPNSFYMDETNPSTCNGKPGKTPIKWGLFGPFVKDINGNTINSQTYHYNNRFGEAEEPSVQVQEKINLTSKRLGGHGALLWYHDHAMMRTSMNVYSGLAGAYIVEGEEEDRTLYKLINNFDLEKEQHDIPLLISDKSFAHNGKFLYYNTSQHQFDSIGNKVGEDGQPEFFGNTIVVNGKIWPKQNVDRGLYRYRVFNTSSSRFYSFALLQLNKDGSYSEIDPAKKALIQIGTEGGLIAGKNVEYSPYKPLTLAPGERADVLVNFSEMDKGAEILLVNMAKAEPFGIPDSSNLSIEDFKSRKTSNTNFVMKFVVSSASNKGNISAKNLNDALVTWKTDPNLFENYNNLEYYNILSLKNNKSYKKPAPAETNFDLHLEEANTISELKGIFLKYHKTAGPADFYAIFDTTHLSFPMVLMNGDDWNSEVFSGSINDTIKDNEYQNWKVINHTGDAHPIHIHLNRFRIVKRTDTLGVPDPTFDVNGILAQNSWKDILVSEPATITMLKIQFVLHPIDKKIGFGQFVYHCHILEHEDMSMMRRLVIKTK